MESRQYRNQGSTSRSSEEVMLVKELIQGLAVGLLAGILIGWFFL